MPDGPPAGGTRALAWIYCPAEQRPPLGALLAIEREIAASLRPGLEHAVAHARLAWWREECARAAAGRPGHPLMQELAAHLGTGAAGTFEAITGLVGLAEWDLARATFGTRRELKGYCERWSTAILVPLAHGTTASVAALREIGTSLREIELLLDLAGEARAGRIRVPLDELESLGATPENLARPPWPPALAELLRGRHAALRARLAAGVASLAPNAQPPLRGVIAWAALAARDSARAAQRLPQGHLTGEHRAVLDGWRAWRTARRAAAGRARLPGN
jgi:15-cis-phytoene synthase